MGAVAQVSWWSTGVVIEKLWNLGSTPIAVSHGWV